MSSTESTKPISFYILRALLLIITGSLALLAVTLPLSDSVTDTTLQVGEVASLDILAPYAISYTSEVLTEQQREAAISSVTPKYTLHDTNIARQQLDRLRESVTFITNVRADYYASHEQKMTDLAALEDVYLSQESAEGILGLTDSRWQAVQQEAIRVLEQVMRNTIREDQIEDSRRSIPNLVSLSLSEEQAVIVAGLVSAFITPNSSYSAALTDAARQEAADAVTPIPRVFAAGETIVERGSVVSTLDIEALQQFGLAEPETRWQDRAGSITLLLLSIALTMLYLRRDPELVNDFRGLVLIAVIFLILLIGARLSIPGHVVIPYLYPLPAFALIVAALFRSETALILTIPLAILTTYGLPNSLELTLYYALGSVFGVLLPKREQRITAYLWVGVAIAASGAAVITAYRLTQHDVDWIGMATLAAAAIINGGASAGITVLLQYFLAPLLGLTTPLQLVELSRPDHPLLEYLLRNAPGTYQHSLQVANLAEQAAERIDAESLLTRVGALYHDIGKVVNAQFFIENQISVPLNPHDDLDPIESATTIIHHVNDGLRLAGRHRLPQRIQAFINEHHGTLKTSYQLTQAINAAGGDASLVDPQLFQYPGVRPQSRETALVMLADGCEARIRAQRPGSVEELRALIKDTIDSRVSAGQLDNTDLTLRDLNAIVDSFTATLRGIYHPRIEYPKLETGEEDQESIVDEAQSEE